MEATSAAGRADSAFHVGIILVIGGLFGGTGSRDASVLFISLGWVIPLWLVLFLGRGAAG